VALLRILQWWALSSYRVVLAEEAGELSRYRADVTAAHLPIGIAAVAGALCGFLTFFVPVGVVAGCMLLISVTFNFGILPFQWLVRTFGIRVPRGEPVTGPNIAQTAVPALPTARATEIPALPPEGVMPDESAALTAVALVLFWPLAMLAVGALIAAVYRFRRRRAIDALMRSPIELAILPEVAVFYALTAGGGMLVGVGTFVAFGANLAFAWAGFLIWRWLFDRLAWRLAPAAVRAEAQETVERERDYRKRAREAG
jgi:hypothetical protein